MAEELEKKHSTLSPSKAARWIACPPSIEMEKGIPDKTSSYAQEGTLAHEIAEVMLKLRGHPFTLELEMMEFRKNPLYSADMPGYVQKYVDYVLSYSSGATLFNIEQRVPLDFLEPGGFGSADAILIRGDRLHVFDLKYGTGVRVEAKENKQAMLYAAGAVSFVSDLWDIANVTMHIIQPRLDSITEWTIPVYELDKFLREVAVPAAKLALKGEGELNPGDHCKFCKAKGKCRAKRDSAMKIAEHQFKPPRELTTEEINDILLKESEVKEWLSAVSDHALFEARNGVSFPGFKLVESKTIRKITDPVTIASRLSELGLSEEDYMKKELKGLTALEKLVGKTHFSRVSTGCIEKPKGVSVLAPKTDKRPEYSETIFSDTENTII